MVGLANIQKGNIIYDLGSGDGRLLFLSLNAGAGKAIGIEINPLLVLWSNFRALILSKKHAHTRWGNFWRADLTDADVVFVYLLPWRMGKLARKLKKELKPGARIVSNSFIFPDWKILRQDRVNHIYVFTA